MGKRGSKHTESSSKKTRPAAKRSKQKHKATGELARLLEREREASRLGEALAEVDRILHSSRDSDEITIRALAEGARAIGAETGAVIAREGDGWLTLQSLDFEPSVAGVRLTDEENPHGVAALASAKVVAIDDAFNDPSVNCEVMRGYGLRSAIVAPLILRGEAFAGLYYNYNSAIHHFTQPEIDFVAHLAASLSAALENARLFRQQQERLLRSETVNGLLELAATAVDSVQVAKDCLKYVAERLDVDAVTLWGADESAQRLYPVAVRGFPARFLKDYAGGVEFDVAPAVATVYRSGEAVVFGIDDDMPAYARDTYIEYGVSLGALLVLPLKGMSASLGGIEMAWREPRAFAEVDVAFYTSIARAIAIATESARLVEAERAQLARAELLREIAQIASGSLSLEAICQSVLDRLSGLPDLAAAAAHIIDDSGPVPVLRSLAAIGYADDVLEGIRELPISDSSNPGRLALGDLDVLTHEDPGMPPETLVRLARMGLSDVRWIVLPIRSGDRLIGTLGLTISGERSFNAGEVSLFAGVAAALGPPIVNAQLYGELAEASARVSAILTGIGDAFVAVDSSWRYILVNERAEQMLGRTAADLIGKRMDEEFPDVKGWPFYRHAMTSRMPISFESFAEMANVWVEVHVYPTLDGLSMIVGDITDRKNAELALEQSRKRADMLAMLLDDSSQPFVVSTPDGHFTLFNPAFRKLTSYSAAELAALKWPDDVTTPETLPIDAAATERIDRTGEPQRFEKVLLRKDGGTTPAEVLRHGHRGLDGTVEYYYAFITDTSERKAAERREAERHRLDAALSAIGGAVTTTLDSEEILHRLVRLPADAIGAEMADLALLQHGSWVLRESFGTSDEAQESVLTDKRLEAVLFEMKELQPVVVDDTESDPRVDPNVMRRLGVGSLMVVPIIAQGTLAGALTFKHVDPVPFTAEQIDFARSLMGIVTLALENARLYEREHRIADTLQKAILTEPESVAGIESSVVYRPASTSANVGGDFYDVFRVDDERVGIVVGDVSGKGLEAARLTSIVRDGIRAYAYEDHNPRTVVRRVNSLVDRFSTPEMFATLFYGVLSPPSGLLEYCVAGHPQPMVVNARGARFLGGYQSPLVGSFSHVEYTQCEILLDVGEMLVLYTDGVTEARAAGEMLGESRLLETLNRLSHTSTAKMPERVLAEVLEYSGGRLRDDTVVLCVRRIGKSVRESVEG